MTPREQFGQGDAARIAEVGDLRPTRVPVGEHDASPVRFGVPERRQEGELGDATEVS